MSFCGYPLTFVTESSLPTKYGVYSIRVYEYQTMEIPVIIYGKLEDHNTEVPVRVHDACFTGEVLHSLKCDCASQLNYSLEYIHDVGTGIVVYLPQEGRGIGLGNKLKAYNKQASGSDTVEANLALGLPIDNRNYDVVPRILTDLKIKSIRLISNNPKKFDDLRSLGVKITDRISAWVPDLEQNEYLQTYINTKITKMNHYPQ